MAANTQLNTRTENGIKRSIEYFEQIIERDPIFALAHAGLAEAYSLGGRYHIFPPQESWNRARTAAVNALRIDDSLVEAYTTLAFVELHQHRDWRSAGQGFSKAIALNPNYATARRWYAWCLAAAGCQELALSNIRRALAINPSSPNANADLAQVMYFARQYDESIQQCRRTVELGPPFHRIYQILGLLYFQKKDYRAAIEHFQTALRLSGGDQRTAVLLAHTLATMGETDEARQLLAELSNLRGAYVSAMNFALLYSALGNNDRMFAWLEKAYFEDDGDLIWLSIDPIYDQARNDDRFSTFLDHIAYPARLPAGQRSGPGNASVTP
jgi:tetratricopeptide (TPR) repeat protein